MVEAIKFKYVMSPGKESERCLRLTLTTLFEAIIVTSLYEESGQLDTHHSEMFNVNCQWATWTKSVHTYVTD